MTLLEAVQEQCASLDIVWPEDLPVCELVGSTMTDQEAISLIAEYGIYAYFAYYSGETFSYLQEKYRSRP